MACTTTVPVQIGDHLHEGEDSQVLRAVPYFAPELFRRVVLKIRSRQQLQKGVLQLCESHTGVSPPPHIRR